MKMVIRPIEITYKERIINPIDTILDFIVNTYLVEDYPKILEIAAGSGNLSELLSKKGYQVTAMDPRLQYRRGVSYEVITESFYEYTDISDYDLGVAIHPCGIHKDIINNFKVNEKALFLMPCYNITCDDRELITYKNNEEWLNSLESFNPKMKKKVFFAEEKYNLLLKSFSNAFYTKK